MADHPNILLRGLVKYRDGKKWKTRWCVLEKSSPVADEINILLYRSLKAYREDIPRHIIPISCAEFCGMECSLTIQRHPNVLSIVCLQGIVLLGFDQPEKMVDWQHTIRAALGYYGDQKFTVSIPNRGKLSPGPATLYLCQDHFAITTSVPVKLLGSWNLHDLSKYGNIDDGFAFEVNKTSSSTGGTFVLLTEDGYYIKDALDTVSRRDMQVNTIRQSFESEANLESRPLLTFTNECVVTVERKPEDQPVQPELTKRDIIHIERRTSLINTDDSFNYKYADISNAFIDHENRRMYRKSSLGECLTKKTTEEFELQQRRKMSVPNCMTSYCNPEERYSGGHLEDYDVISEIHHDLAKYTTLTYTKDKLNINGLSMTHGANQGKTKNIFIENLKNGNNIDSGLIRDAEYELMAPLGRTGHGIIASAAENGNQRELIRDAEYELMAPQKDTGGSHFKESNNPTNSNWNTVIPEDYQQCSNISAPVTNTLIRDAEYELMGPLASGKKVDEVPNQPIREAEYELMHPGPALPCPYRNLPSNSKIMQHSNMDLKSVVDNAISPPIRDIEYEIMNPLRKGVALTPPDSEPRAPTTSSYIDYRKQILPHHDKKDVFSMMEFGDSATLTDSSGNTSPRPVPVSFKLLTPPSSPTHEMPLIRPRTATCKLQGISIAKEDIPAPFEHSDLLLPTQIISPTKTENHAVIPNLHGKDEGKGSKKSKRKRCVTEPTRAGSPNSLDAEAEQTKTLLTVKHKNGDGSYPRKRSLTDPDFVKAREKSKSKGSFRKSKKKKVPTATLR